ncbi:PREDICTED: ABC transporter E family member 2-like [Camelina sativa]|uniref:ABC transporter E family member 2-like n=1 Tax=Camelina sativa TaxID=90675 RepID=A0ABM0Y404_CAMSA|nr:PREDICTED: ABC transporter E family member 2-like [Camelina sativa]
MTLPAPRTGELLGLLGTHSIGKSTALKLLAGVLKPNLGRFTNPPEWQEILNHCGDKDLQTYFTQFLDKKLKVAMKPQHFEDMKGFSEPVRKLLDKHNERGMMNEICDNLELNEVLDRRVRHLSGDMLQRVMIAVVALQKADVYIFDEPSSLLDVSQRFRAAQVIRSLLTPDSYVIVSDNDISVLDYLSDAIYCFYGKPEACGIVSLPFNVRAGIEIFLDGFDPSQNLRIRDESLIFEVARTPRPPPAGGWRPYKYPNMSETSEDFTLEVQAGEFTDSQVLVMLGENSTGKTTNLQMLAGKVAPDSLENFIRMDYVSYKPQRIAWKGECTVRQLPELSLHLADMHPDFISDVMKPLQMEQLLDRKVASLSCGETQRVALTICLGKFASVYLIDEPGAYLDSELRINAAMAIRRHVLRMENAAIVVEHDLTMATYMADQVIVVDKISPAKCTANPPLPLVSGMNRFLSHLDITFRRDRISFNATPRVNKLGSIEDTMQKAAGNYYDV